MRLVNKDSFIRWYDSEGSPEIEIKNFYVEQDCEPRSFVAFCPNEFYSFLINIDANLLGCTLDLVDSNTFSVIVPNISPLVPLLQPNGAYFAFADFYNTFSIYGYYRFAIKKEGVLQYISNPVIFDIDAGKYTNKMAFSDTRPIGNYNYEINEFFTDLRIMLTRKSIDYEATLKQYKNVVDGTFRNINFETDKIYRLESYDFNDKDHEALVHAFKHASIRIGDVWVIPKEPYKIVEHEASYISKGGITVYETRASGGFKFSRWSIGGASCERVKCGDQTVNSGFMVASWIGKIDAFSLSPLDKDGNLVSVTGNPQAVIINADAFGNAAIGSIIFIDGARKYIEDVFMIYHTGNQDDITLVKGLPVYIYSDDCKPAEIVHASATVWSNFECEMLEPTPMFSFSSSGDVFHKVVEFTQDLGVEIMRVFSYLGDKRHGFKVAGGVPSWLDVTISEQNGDDYVELHVKGTNTEPGLITLEQNDTGRIITIEVSRVATEPVFHFVGDPNNEFLEVEFAHNQKSMGVDVVSLLGANMQDFRLASGNPRWLDVWVVQGSPHYLIDMQVKDTDTEPGFMTFEQNDTGKLIYIAVSRAYTFEEYATGSTQLEEHPSWDHTGTIIDLRSLDPQGNVLGFDIESYDPRYQDVKCVIFPTFAQFQLNFEENETGYEIINTFYFTQHVSGKIISFTMKHLPKYT